MAAEATASTTTLKLMVEKGTGKDGQPLYAARNVSGISPDLTDDDALDLGKDLASLQTHDFGYVQRVNTFNLHEA
ncbi:MAG: DUF1659 domain-containing protein [Selenomonas sp.]|nr:DUF1659 domain-containing protein [Selenomonas sp.]